MSYNFLVLFFHHRNFTFPSWNHLKSDSWSETQKMSSCNMRHGPCTILKSKSHFKKKMSRFLSLKTSKSIAMHGALRKLFKIGIKPVKTGVHLWSLAISQLTSSFIFRVLPKHLGDYYFWWGGTSLTCLGIFSTLGGFKVFIPVHCFRRATRVLNH